MGVSRDMSAWMCAGIVVWWALGPGPCGWRYVPCFGTLPSLQSITACVAGKCGVDVGRCLQPPPSALRPHAANRPRTHEHVDRRLAAHRRRPAGRRAGAVAAARARLAAGPAHRHAAGAQGRPRRVRGPAGAHRERLHAGADLGALREPQGPRHPRRHPHRQGQRQAAHGQPPSPARRADVRPGHLVGPHRPYPRRAPAHVGAHRHQQLPRCHRRRLLGRRRHQRQLRRRPAAAAARPHPRGPPRPQGLLGRPAALVGAPRRRQHLRPPAASPPLFPHVRLRRRPLPRDPHPRAQARRRRRRLLHRLQLPRPPVLGPRRHAHPRPRRGRQGLQVPRPGRPRQGEVARRDPGPGPHLRLGQAERPRAQPDVESQGPRHGHGARRAGAVTATSRPPDAQHASAPTSPADWPHSSPCHHCFSAALS
ncbi:uncharacterized protein EKO05_0004445 [Ascochyta rabiei]|uniref:uncharacterized protein n=1 Tax=Didymella rabiei TaxID=5454 RepID=UPI00220CD16C|nr:uncharacterized protein EKO05_0004445 [Ascochyta rabiei]UPX13951.1 hypothetical protein EKO05_0004445 [Ascochyta rabiei]